MGLSQRTINRTRFYRPTRASLTKKERMFAQEGLDRDYRRNTELDVPDFDFVALETKHPIMTRRTAMQYLDRPEDFEPDYFNMGAFQITYNFSHAIRKNMFPMRSALPFSPKAIKEYGAAGWSFRMLYEFLCEAYNGGVPFVDTYFERVFKTRPVYVRFLLLYDTIQDNINNEQFELLHDVPLKEDGTPDMRYTASKKFMDFKVWQDPIIKQGCKSIAADIRHDIEVCLSTGKLPLRGREGATVSRKTKKLRSELAGLDPARLFYASGQLIRHLNVFVEIGDKVA